MASQDGHPEAQPGAQSKVVQEFGLSPKWRATRQALVVVQLDRDGPGASDLVNTTLAIFAESGLSTVLCRSLAEVGRRLTAIDAACILIPGCK